MKAHIISTLLLFATNNFCFSDGIPQEVARLDEQRDSAIRKIDEKYVEELENIKKALTKTGDLEAALAVDSKIKSIQSQMKPEPKKPSAQDLLLSGPWSIKFTSKDSDTYTVRFNNDGFAISEKTKDRIWKWRIEGETLWCNWLSTGWVKFDIDDNSKSQKWIGKAKNGDHYTMTLIPSR